VPTEESGAVPVEAAEAGAAAAADSDEAVETPEKDDDK
jgi:hypothetical protein